MAENFPKNGNKQKPNVFLNPSIKGRNNFIDPSAENVICFGDSNYIGYNVKDSQIFNSSGCVIPANLRNVSITNSSGIIVTENDTIVVNNKIENEKRFTTYNTSPVNAVVFTQPNNTTMIIQVEAMAISAAFDINYGSTFFYVSRCYGSTVNIFGSQSNEFSSGGTVLINIIASGQTVIIQLVGEATTMNWKVKYSFKII